MSLGKHIVEHGILGFHQSPLSISVGSGRDYATLADACTALSAMRLDGITCTVTVYGLITETTGAILSKVNAAGTTITGEVSTLSLSSVQSSSGSAGNWSIIVNMNSVAGAAVGQVLGIAATSGGTNGHRLTGAFRITNVDAVNTRLTLHSTHPQAVAPSGAVTASCVLFKTVLTAYPGHSIVTIKEGATLGSLTDIAWDGADNSPHGITAISGGRLLNVNYTDRIAIVRNDTGVECNQFGQVLLGDLYLGASNTLSTSEFGAARITNCYMYGGDQAASLYFGGALNIISLYASGITDGFAIDTKSNLFIQGGTLQDIPGTGYAAYNGATIYSGATNTNVNTISSPTANTLGTTGEIVII